MPRIGSLLHARWLVAALSACGVSHAQPAPDARTAPSAPSAEPAVLRVAVALEAAGRLAWEPAVAAPARAFVRAPCALGPGHGALSAVSTAVEARVVRWRVEPGEPVAQGAPVVELEAREVAAQRTALALARVDAGELAARLGEERRMFPAGATSGRAVRETERAGARARLEAAGAARLLAVAGAASEGAGGRFVLRAPRAGVLLRRHAVLGATVSAGALLAEVLSPERLRVEVAVPEEHARLREGARAQVRFRAREGLYGATVEHLEAALDERSRTREALLVLDAAPSTEGPLLGETCEALLDAPVAPAGEGAREAPRVDRAALYRDGDRAWVFVRREAGAYEPRAVLVGDDDGAAVTVLDGLRAGEPVVTRGSVLLAAALLREREAGGGP